MALANDTVFEVEINNQTIKRSEFNATINDLEDLIANSTIRKNELKPLVETTDNKLDFLWTLTASIFVVGMHQNNDYKKDISKFKKLFFN